MHKTRELNAGHVPRIVALVPATIIVAAVLNLIVPYYSIAPGPARNVLPMIRVDGTQTYPSKGRLLLTTVSLDSVRAGGAVRGWLDALIDVVPRDDIVPRGRTEEQVDRTNVDQMEDSKQAAAASAVALLGLPWKVTGAGVRVESVVDGGPASGHLRPGDVVIAADGRPVGDAETLIARTRDRPVGNRIVLRVRRDGTEQDVVVVTGPSADDPRVPMIGVRIRNEAGRVELPFTVTIDAGPIGGPSAGLMFALGVYDLLQPGELTKGIVIAGTGVIAVNGRVSPVGGVAQKVAAAERAGAQVFLVPKEEVRQARRAASRMKVVAVGTLSDAVQALNDLQVPVRASGRETTLR